MKTKGEFAIGQAVSRFEDPRLLRGGGRFVDDIAVPGMAYGYVLRSPYANARVRSIDSSAAKVVHGVSAVLTGADWQASGDANLLVGRGRTRRDGSPIYVPPYPALVSDAVRRVGDYVAFVVVDTRDRAMDAAEPIEVDDEPPPAVTGTEDARKSGALGVWPDCPDNICDVHTDSDKAVVDAALAGAEHVVLHKFVIDRVSANSMEPRGCIGLYDAAEDHDTVYSTLQGIHPYRTHLAGVLNMPGSRVRVVANAIVAVRNPGNYDRLFSVLSRYARIRSRSPGALAEATRPAMSSARVSRTVAS